MWSQVSYSACTSGEQINTDWNHVKMLELPVKDINITNEKK